MDSLQWIDSSALAVERNLGEVTRLEMTMISYLGDKATMSELLKWVGAIARILTSVCMFLLFCISEDFFYGRHWVVLELVRSWRRWLFRLAEVQKRDNERLQRSMLEWSEESRKRLWVDKGLYLPDWLRTIIDWFHEKSTPPSSDCH